MTALELQDAARKKQLGQYFTGRRVGRLLAALADAGSAKTIIDPMVGSADLLVSCIQVGAANHRLVGLELDPLALAEAKAALEDVPGAELVLGDAFSATLPPEQFDLVITNPPYIRYQSKGEVEGIRIPSGSDVRDGLVRAILSRQGLPTDIQARLLQAAHAYPGTADIAVPAWILSASLVREDGVLAVVAPQAWLSRNYAQPVRELLDEIFDVEFIVEDGDASWFPDAQVRTHLVVARRRALGLPSGSSSVVHARATAQLDTQGDLRGSLRSEAAVAVALGRVTATHSVDVTTGLTAHIERDLVVAAAGQAGNVPMLVAAALGVSTADVATRTLESYGWRVGQGLRTGANDFFYVTIVGGLARPASRWSTKALPIPSECLLPAVRRQSDLGGDLDIATGEPLPSRILYLRGWATAQDKRRMGAAGGGVLALPAAVTRWITEVSQTPFSDKDPTKLFPDLAAVAPNSKVDRSGHPTAFWYQLPELAPRHRPELFLGRVCAGQPTPYANSAGAVVDANFSTLWPTASGALPADALLALLHSSWVWANLEATCTVLGGGALKVEATDLRRLALPDVAAADIERLQVLGRQLLTKRSSEVARAIDDAVALAVSSTGHSAGLRTFAGEAMKRRSRR
ncbi:N-6 DNA methylase [Micromonospora sp. NPDC048842]|uniref:N-6 DNA methylase n=1 Tax=Micromonospora sp. NPDC048842 TaxID=3154346 RepID=UPI0033D1A235